MSKLEVIGYIDDDGFNYCAKHGQPGMEEILSDSNCYLEKCCICGVYIDASPIIIE
jgi:hypothetical protein